MTSECPVCLNEKQLVVTTCKSKHSFCADCLKTLVRQHGTSFPCPVCRQVVSIPSGRVSRLHALRPDRATGDGPAVAAGPESDPGDGRDAGRRNTKPFLLHMRFYRPGGAKDGRRAGPPLSPSSHQRDTGERKKPLPPFQRGDLSEDSEVDRAGHSGTQTDWSRNPAQPHGRPGPVTRGAAAGGFARRLGPSAGRNPYSGGPRKRLSEDEQMAVDLQAAEYQTTRSFRSPAGRFGTSSVHGRPVEGDAFSPPEPSLPFPPQPSRHRPSFFPSRAGNRRAGHDTSLSLAPDSDESLALRLQEEEIRRASERARGQMLARGAHDEDDLFALRLQEEEIRAARRQEKDRQVAQRYRQGLTDTQGLVNGLQRVGFFDHIVGDHRAGPASVERREEVTGPGEPDVDDSNPNSPPGRRRIFETRQKDGPAKFEFFSFSENTGNDGRGFFDTSENDGHSQRECFDIADHDGNGRPSFLHTSEHDGPSELRCYDTAEHGAETGERTVFDESEHDAAGDRTLFDNTSFTYDSSDGQSAYVSASENAVPDERVSFHVGHHAVIGERTFSASTTQETPGESTPFDCGELDARIVSTFFSSGEHDEGPGERNNVCFVEEQNSYDEGGNGDSRLSVFNYSRLSNAAAETRQAEEETQPEGERCGEKKKKKKKKTRRGERGGGGGDRGSACERPPGLACGDP